MMRIAPMISRFVVKCFFKGISFRNHPNYFICLLYDENSKTSYKGIGILRKIKYSNHCWRKIVLLGKFFIEFFRIFGKHGTMI